MVFHYQKGAKKKRTKYIALPNITSGFWRAFAIHHYGFSFYLTGIDPETEIPPTSLLDTWLRLSEQSAMAQSYLCNQ